MSITDPFTVRNEMVTRIKKLAERIPDNMWISEDEYAENLRYKRNLNSVLKQLETKTAKFEKDVLSILGKYTG